MKDKDDSQTIDWIAVDDAELKGKPSPEPDTTLQDLLAEYEDLNT